TPDWIGMIRHDDGDRRRGALRRFGRGCGPRHDPVNPESDQLRRESRKPFDPVLVESALDDDVLALDVPEFPQPLKESSPDMSGLRAARRGTPEKADPIDFRGR